MAYIEQEKVLNMLNRYFHNLQGDNAQTLVCDIKQAFLELPTADVVKVVRCKDCVNRVEFDINKFHCELTGYYCGEMGYCSDAVRTPKERGGEK